MIASQAISMLIMINENIGSNIVRTYWLKKVLMLTKQSMKLCLNVNYIEYMIVEIKNIYCLVNLVIRKFILTFVT